MRIMFLFLGLVAVVPAGGGASPEAGRLTRLLESRYRNTRTLSVVFLERYSENGRSVHAESGKAYFRRPGKMRWEYEAPEAKLFLNDGRTIWFYVPADRTAMRSRAKDSADWRTPFLLLTKNPKVSDLCARVLPGAQDEPATAGGQVLHCEPRGTEKAAAKTGRGRGDGQARERAEEEILLEVSPVTGDLLRVLIRQAGGVELEFRFCDWVWNPPLADSEFEFHAPPGVAIVEGRPRQ